MKAISIQQPWSFAILNYGKDIENRSWHTNFRGRVLIHAGKKIDLDGLDSLEIMGFDPPCKDQYKTGGIVGSVEIVDCVKKSESRWFFGEYGFVLRNPVILPFMPVRGQLGFFDVEYAEARP